MESTAGEVMNVLSQATEELSGIRNDMKNMARRVRALELKLERLRQEVDVSTLDLNDGAMEFSTLPDGTVVQDKP